MRTVLLCSFAVLCAMFPGAARAQLGSEVTNVATVAYEINGVPTHMQTNVAVFTIEAVRTESSVHFYRYSPGAPDITVQVNGSDYTPAGTIPPPGLQPGGAGDPFVPIGPAVTLSGASLDLSRALPLAEAAHFFVGELIFVRVVDAGQNGDPSRVETVVIEVRSPTGDSVVLRLYETGPDTGEFMAYVPSVSSATPANDPALTTPENVSLTAVYQDPFDADEVSTDTALVDPFGRVFNSLTGELIDGARVTIVSAATGQPAVIFGLDGMSAYPSTVVTGASVTDAGGNVYQLQPGQFFFPRMAPGDYRLVIEPPVGYAFPSARTEAELAGLPNAPFTIIPASYGNSFALTGPDAVNFDVPLDPAGELLLQKSVSGSTASIGDVVGYTIEVSNRNNGALPLRITDSFPAGFRLVPGSLRLGGAAVGVPDLAPDGSAMTVDAGLVGSGETVRLTYTLAVSAGARPGPAINRAVAVDGSGNPLSNAATASIEVVEDLLRDRLTLIGRVVEEGCDGTEAWSRELAEGTGVAGVRLYLETGAYVVTDKDGLYHFEGVTPGTHVVQVDVASLPAGYEVMTCEENTRLAGSSISAFVDARGGSVWRANFYLKRTGDVAEVAKAEADDDTTEYLGFDAEWLNAQAGGMRWVYPATDRTPSSRSVNIGILHPRDFKVELTLNGSPVPAANGVAGLTSEMSFSALSRWRGVDILAGENTFVARILDPSGKEVGTLTETIWHISRIERAALVADQSQLAADGRTPPVIALRLEDASGRPVHRGRSIKVEVSSPYELLRDDSFDGDGITSARSGGDVSVGNDGIARVELQPTLQTGRAKVSIRLDDGSEEVFEVWLTPEKRDWILVGLTEGSAGLADPSDMSDAPISDLKDGRVAFFAKGMVKGDWLLTLAVDTAKRRGARDASLFDGQIDPNAYYTLYGDRTSQGSDAESRYPLYVKLEKDTVQLLFGDFNTDLGDLELGRYDRRLSGLRAESQGRNVSVTGFAAETNQGFVKDELVADGTSGPYRLSMAPVVRNSERIVIETRDRVRPDVIVEARPLARWIDYDLDYRTGELIFRHPVDATDSAFNPRVIVIDFEAETGAERNVTFGGRASIHTDDGALEAGVTYVHEDGSPFAAGASGDLAAIDAEARISDNTSVRAEIAATANGGPSENRSTAWLVEAEHQTEDLSVTGYVREDEAGFGLGQQGSATAGIRRAGVDARAHLSATVDPRTGERKSLAATGSAYREENLETGAARDVAEVSASQDSERAGYSAGLKAVRETYEDGAEPHNSLLVTASVRRTLPDHGLTVTLTHEQPLSGRDEASLFPERTLASIDKTLTSWATLNLRHEINNGANASGDTTLAGVTILPWQGGEIRMAADQMTQNDTDRLSAVFGVDQSFALSPTWSASLGASRRARIDGGDEVRDIAPDTAVSPFDFGAASDLAAENDFTSAYAGVGYLADRSAASIRFEYRDSEFGERWTTVVGAAREASASLSYGAALRAETVTGGPEADTASAEARLGLAWRPRGEGVVVFARLDAKTEEQDGVSDVSKLVGNLATNVRLSERAEAAFSYGLKFQEADIAGSQSAGVTQFFGAELRHDLTQRFDIGFAASALVDHRTETADFAFGPSLGFTPADNMWISVGYILSGFRDADFDAAEYSRDGLYVKVRVKFDEQTAQGLLKRISPN